MFWTEPRVFWGSGGSEREREPMELPGDIHVLQHHPLYDGAAAGEEQEVYQSPFASVERIRRTV
jgi:hypothetical protein